MPVFEFQCPGCRRIVEKLQRYEDPEPRCVVCNQPTKRKVSRTSFILKGGGWFKDSYSSEAP